MSACLWCPNCQTWARCLVRALAETPEKDHRQKLFYMWWLKDMGFVLNFV